MALTKGLKCPGGTTESSQGQEHKSRRSWKQEKRVDALNGRGSKWSELLPSTSPAGADDSSELDRGGCRDRDKVLLQGD
jgi:hypothetical protein